MKQDITGNGNNQVGIQGDVNGDVILNAKLRIDGAYIIPCPDCKNPVSSYANACPLCGFPVIVITKKMKIESIRNRHTKASFIMLILIGFLYGLTFIVTGIAQKYLYFGIVGLTCLIAFGWALIERINQ